MDIEAILYISVLFLVLKNAEKRTLITIDDLKFGFC